MRSFITVEAEHSKVLDDGFYINNFKGGWLVEFFIATPALALTYNTSIVKQAEFSAQTVYSGARVKQEMFPNKTAILNCSLVPGTPKTALMLAVLIDAGGKANLQSINIVDDAESIGNLSHKVFGEILQNKNHELHEISTRAVNCARALFDARTNKNGNKTGFLDEINGSFTNEEGGIATVSLREMHGQILIQELMIMSNDLLTIYAKENNLPIIFKNHESNNIDSPKGKKEPVYEMRNVESKYLSNDDIDSTQRAEYSRDNKGHHGLQLNAYATFTSPLRRFSDLHNEYVMLGHLKGTEIPIISEQRCEALNKRIDAMKLSDKEKFKRSAGYFAMRAIYAGENVTPNQFCQIIKRHPSQESKDRAMREFLERDEMHLSTQIWAALITHPQNLNKSTAIGIATLFSQHEGVMVGTHHHLYQILSFKHELIDGENFNPKKLYNLLCESIGLEADEVPSINIQSDMADNFEPNFNYKGKALEICMKLKIEHPTIQFNNIETPHLPVWVAETSYIVGSKEIVLKEHDTAKKRAEAKVYKGLLDVLNDIDEPARASIDTQNKDAKSILAEFCQKKNMPAPTFSDRQLNYYKWEVTYTLGGKDFQSFTGTGGNKHEANEMAAQQALSFLSMRHGDLSMKPTVKVRATNPKSVMSELQIKNVIENLYYNTQPESDGFISTCHFRLNGDAVCCKGELSAQKKAAEQSAASKAIMKYGFLKKTRQKNSVISENNGF